MKTATKLKTLKRDLSSQYTPASADKPGPYKSIGVPTHDTSQFHPYATILLKSLRSIKMLDDQISKVESEYDILQEEVAKGETSDFGTALEAHSIFSKGYNSFAPQQKYFA